MKFIEVGKQTTSEGRMEGGSRRSLGNILPTQGKPAQKAQETVINLFQKILDNRFIMLQSVRFQDWEGLTPLVLVGPPGMWVIEASPVSGIFRASGEKWEEMDEKGRTFRPAKPNLPVRTASAVQSLELFLTTAGIEPPPIEPVLIFTHPGAHLELQQPVTRLIQADAIGRFAAGLLKSPIVLEKTAVQALAERLSVTPADMAMEDVADDFVPVETESPHLAIPQMPHIPAQLEEEPTVVKRVSRFTNFTRFQWIFLAGLVVFNILVLILVILVIVWIT
jgi:hypothetical protein